MREGWPQGVTKLYEKMTDKASARTCAGCVSAVDQACRIGPKHPAFVQPQVNACFDQRLDRKD